jgi:hypothetical protein
LKKLCLSSQLHGVETKPGEDELRGSLDVGGEL